MKNRCKKLLLLLLLVGITPAVMAQYGFGTNTPDKSAVVDLKSSNKGFLPPRLTQKQIDDLPKNSSPAEGLIVYNTDKKCLMYYSLGAFTEFYTPPGLAPVASGVAVDGSLKVGNTLNATYTFMLDNMFKPLEAGTSTYKWYSATVDGGSDGIELLAVTTNEYKIPPGKEGTYVRVGVTPVAVTGKTGIESYSKWYRVNSAPSYTGLTISPSSLNLGGGDAQVVGSYFDGDGDTRGAPTYQWYRCDNNAGGGKVPIGSNSSSYALAPADMGSYIGVSVRVVAETGVLQGAEQFVCSVDPVGVTGHHLVSNGAPVDGAITYPVVKIGTQKWLGRNLGATEDPGSFMASSPATRGWYWQFNNQQGYQSSTVPNPSWPDGDVTKANWAPANDPCNSLHGLGWRLPTIAEWESLLSANPTGYKLYDSVLHLHAAGFLEYKNGTLTNLCLNGAYYSSTYESKNYGNFLYVPGGNASPQNNQYKATACSVRCVRDF